MGLTRIAAVIAIGALCASTALAVGGVKTVPVKAPPLTTCDELAANPLDPEHVGAGVPLVLIDAPAAVAACTAALDLYPDSLRILYQLGRAYDAEENYGRALLHYMLAADRGYAASYSNLGRLYDYGIGVEADRDAAYQWYQRGVEAGNANAMFSLAVLLEGGTAGQGNSVQAVALIQRAAELDHPEAVYALGAIYAQGDRGLPQDSEKAVELYIRAADLGSSAAAVEVGNLYLNGESGLEQDYEKAAAYFEIAGNGGRSEALYNLGVLKEYGYLGEPDFVAAADYYRRASDLGNAGATYNLGALFETGRGVELDHATAARLVFDAVKGGDPFARQKMAEGATQFSVAFRTELQRLLADDGLLDGESDGTFGPETLSALDALAEIQ